jgi:hypothetical protein
MRKRRAIYRRIYQVRGPLSLCHMDGNHKLRPWGLVIHGMVDGFSSYIPYLVVAARNDKAFVLNVFVRVSNIFETCGRRCWGCTVPDARSGYTVAMQEAIAHSQQRPGSS